MWITKFVNFIVKCSQLTTWRFGETGDTEMSDLVLKRGPSTQKTTPGELTQDGNHLCWTLEPPKTNPKEPVCIPSGRYPVIMQWSTRFQMDTPHLQNVPGRSLIEIHPLNDEHLVTLPDGTTHWTTEGCIGPGMTKDTDWVSSSVEALKTVVIPAVEAGLKQGAFYIQILDPSEVTV